MSFTISGTSGLTFPDTTNQTTAATASIPSGSKTNFLQAAAPTGWTQCTTYNNYAMRLVSGTGGGTGGSVAFTTAFASQTPAGTISGGAVACTTLSTAQMPSHDHTGNWQYYSGNAGGTFSYGSFNTGSPADNNLAWRNIGSPAVYARVAANGGGGSHTHTFTQPSFSGTAINLAVQYVDNIVAIKN